MPGADIWDDDDEWQPTRVETTWREVTGEDESWLVEAQVVVHPEDQSGGLGRPITTVEVVGIEVDEDDEREGFGTKLNRWSRTSMVGATLSGIGIGLQKVLYAQDPIQIEIQADADDEDHLDPVEGHARSRATRPERRGAPTVARPTTVSPPGRRTPRPPRTDRRSARTGAESRLRPCGGRR